MLLLCLPGWSSGVAEAVAADVSEDASGTVAVDAKSELGIIGTLENILLNSVNEKFKNYNSLVVFPSLFFVLQFFEKLILISSKCAYKLAVELNFGT